MEKIKKARTPIRSNLTRTLSEAEKLLQQENTDINATYFYREKLDEIFTNLSTKDELVLDGMLEANCTDEEYEAETVAIAAIDRYRDNYRLMIIQIDSVCQTKTRSQVDGSVADTQSTLKKRTFKLPKIELRKFSGTTIDWLSWWNQFSKIDEDDHQLHVSAKFEYLVQSMEKGSRALELVESYPRTNENYPKAIAALKNRFGRDEMLVEVYVRELLKLVVSNVSSRDGQKLSNMFDKLESHLRALESIGVTSANYAAMLYPMVESSLPEEVLCAWKRSPLSIVQTNQGEDKPKKTKLDLLMDFLRSEVESEESIALARDGFGSTMAKSKKRDKISKEEDEHFSTAAGLFSSKNSMMNCVFCDGNHSSADCVKAQLMSLDVKKEKLKSKRCCWTCLIPGKGRHICNAQVQCQLCKKRHPSLMCYELPQNKNNRPSRPISKDELPKKACSARVQKGDVPLQTLMVKYRKDGQFREMRILLDCGNQRSYTLS